MTKTITKEFSQGDSYYGHPTPDMRLNAPSVSKTDIEDLIDELAISGIVINENLCEKHIGYEMEGKHKQATIPIESSFSYNVTVDGLVLRYKNLEGNLEITISDYSESNADNPRVIGGNIRVSKGIRCKMEFVGEGKGEPLIEAAEKIIRSYYHPFNFGRKPYDPEKLLKKPRV
jgi:hypothetical protein